ncbi:MAG: TIGR00730 family Rossman fold protein [Bacteroidia bacterium]
MKVCVYCASSAKINPVYFKATQKLAIDLVKHNFDVVYGGGATGLMGQLADTILLNGGNIKGIMPKFMNEVEWAHKKVSDFEFTETMHERKAKFLEGTDALIALPGGSGTFEELFEAITLKRLGLFTKPIVILNTNNYYDPIMNMMQKCVDEHFMRSEHLKMWDFVNEPEEVITAIKNAQKWSREAINMASYQHK